MRYFVYESYRDSDHGISSCNILRGSLRGAVLTVGQRPGDPEAIRYILGIHNSYHGRHVPSLAGSHQPPVACSSHQTHASTSWSRQREERLA